MTDSEKIDRALAAIRAQNETRRGSDWYQRVQPPSNERSDWGGRGWSGGSMRGDAWAGGRER